jgi:hypothetical protein
VVNDEVVHEALVELAARLIIPADMIEMHREHSDGKRKYTSLRHGTFLLTYAPFERFFNRIVEGHGGPSQGLTLNVDKLRQKIEVHTGVPNVTQSWKARARVAPDAARTTNISPWAYLEGNRLRHYLSDGQRLRNLLGHGASHFTDQNKSGTLSQVKNGYSARLMWVEGFLQVTQDLAAQTALTLTDHRVVIPVWPRPPLSGTSKSGLLDCPY